MKAQMGPWRCQGPAATVAPEPSRVEGKQRRNRFHKVLINWDFLRCHSYVLGLTESALKKRKISGVKGQISTGYCRRASRTHRNSNIYTHQLGYWNWQKQHEAKRVATSEGMCVTMDTISVMTASFLQVYSIYSNSCLTSLKGPEHEKFPKYVKKTCQKCVLKNRSQM